MRAIRVLAVVSAVAVVVGLLGLNLQAQRRTQQKLDELLARGEVRPAEPPPAPQPQPAEAPKEEPPRPSAAPYVIETPDLLLIEAELKNSKAGTVRPLPHQAVCGQFPVRADGTIGMGIWGRVAVDGLTLEQATNVIRRHLAKSVEPDADAELMVLVSVAVNNSKRFYVVTDSGGGGERVYAFPACGNETVLDAVAKVEGLAAVAGRGGVRIARRASDTAGWENLPVDWAGITVRGLTATNYQILPGDRVYVTRKPD